MAEKNTTMSADIAAAARAVDFATQFALNWEHLRQILGIMRPIRKEPGTYLTSKYAEVTLAAVPPAEGEAVTFSQAAVKEKTYAKIALERYAKSVTAEAIADHGYDTACELTDKQFLYEIQNSVVTRWYDYLKTGQLIGSETTFQMALAMALGKVKNQFQAMHRGITQVVGFVNILDVYEYLGAANIYNVESQFGLNYIKNFMGYGTLFLLSENEMPRGEVIATPVENISLYYVAPTDSDFRRADLDYKTDGETNYIGVAIKGDYTHGTSITHALCGMTLFSEYIDGIAVINFGNTVNPITVDAEDQSASMYGVPVSDIQNADVAIADGRATGTLKYIDSGVLAQDWGAGYFLALKFVGTAAANATSVLVGLQPSAGAGLQEIINDPDQNGVFKITNKDIQKFKVVITNGETTKTQLIDLSGLTLGD